MEAVGGGGGVLVSNNCFLQQNITTSLLELYFNDSMQTVRARRRRRWQSRKRGRRWGRWADVVFTEYRHRSLGISARLDFRHNFEQRRALDYVNVNKWNYIKRCDNHTQGCCKILPIISLLIIQKQNKIPVYLYWNINILRLLPRK